MILFKDNELKDVSFFSACGQSLLYGENSKSEKYKRNIVKYDLVDKSIIKSKEDFYTSGIFGIGNLIWINLSKEGGCIVLDEGLSVVSKEIFLVLPTGVQSFEDFILVESIEEGNSFFATIDILSRKELWRKKYRIRYFMKSNLGIIIDEYRDRKATVLRLLDPTNGSEKWQFNLSGYLQSISSIYSTRLELLLKKFIGEINGRFYVTTVNGKILEIDSSNGKVTYVWDQLPANKSWSRYQYTNIPNVGKSILDANKNRIIGLSDYYYWFIDLPTKEMQFFDLTDSFTEEKIRVAGGLGMAFDGQYLFFNSEYEDYDSSVWYYKTCAFDPMSQKVVSTFDFDAECKGFKGSAPTINGDRLIVLDRTDTLHILNRQ